MTPCEKYYDVFDTDVFGAVCLTDACIPLLKRAEVPRTVFVSSSQGSLTRTLNPSYLGYKHLFTEHKTSKAAMTTVSAIYEVKYGPGGFLINSACPGLCATNLTVRGFEGAQPPSVGAVQQCRLATLVKGGVNGTFSNVGGIVPFKKKILRRLRTSRRN
jgi:NAD(P)-dependent dehydrogenase (short-subunit alcohol dehydrogenase family)